MPEARSGCGIAELLFEHVDFAKTADVAFFMCKLSAEEGVHALPSSLGADDPGSQHENVHIVVFDTLMGGVGVVTEAGTDSPELVGRHAGTYAASADEHATLGFPIENGASDFLGEVGIVDGGRGVGAHIDNLVALLFQACDDRLFQIVPCMVTAYNNKHD